MFGKIKNWYQKQSKQISNALQKGRISEALKYFLTGQYTREAREELDEFKNQIIFYKRDNEKKEEQIGNLEKRVSDLNDENREMNTLIEEANYQAKITIERSKVARLHHFGILIYKAKNSFEEIYQNSEARKLLKKIKPPKEDFLSKNQETLSKKVNELEEDKYGRESNFKLQNFPGEFVLKETGLGNYYSLENRNISS